MAPSSEKVLRVLSIDASPVDSELIQNALKKTGLPFLLETVTSPEELKDALINCSWTFVISEYESFQMNAIESLRLVHEKVAHLPFILFSHGVGEEGVADMMKQGTYDYISKAKPDRLIQVVKRILSEEVIKAREGRASDLAHKAHAAKEQMLAIVSHDIKNPLSAIQLEAQMLLRVATRHGKSILSEEVKIQAGRILKTTDRLKILISDLLDRNKSENGLSVINREEVDAAKLFQEVLEATRPLIRQKELIVRSAYPAKMIAHLDKNKMFQVLINLVTNAIKFTPEHGMISLMIDEHEHELVFSVRDSGPGLDVNDLHKVFEKYWTGEITGCSGTGLGLFICKTIVEAHGGSIMVENHPEGGAIFSFTLPKPSSLEHSPYIESRKNRRKIMVIDDDEDLREVISWALGKEGFIVQTFKEPLQALEHLRSGKDLPQLILADYQMDGMKGGEFLVLKNDLPSLIVRETPVIMISASPVDIELEVPREHYKEIITKPFDIEELVSSMKRYIP